MGFQVYPHMACPRGCIVALVAFVWLFSTVCFQMCPQSTIIRGSIVALVAFVGLLHTMSPHMSFDNGCMLECIVTLEAFVDIRPGHRLGLWIFHFLVNIWTSIFHLYFAPLLLVSEWDKEKCLEREASVKVKVFSFPTNLFRKKNWFRSLTSWCIFQACSFLLVSLTTFNFFLLVFFFSLWATPLW